MTDLVVFDGNLEIRRVGGGRSLSGRFPYNSTGTVRDRGRRRKEKFSPRAFKYAVQDDLERRIDLLVGHEFGKPLASRQAGTLELRDQQDGLYFDAVLPDPAPSWVTDAERAIDGGLMRGVSPGFTVPPLAVVPDAETYIPEPGNPDVQIRVINAAVLRELSIVTAPVYEESLVELRQDQQDHEPRGRRLWL